MKVIEFIKRNISVLNVIALILLFIGFRFLFSNEIDPYGLGKLISSIILLFAIFILFIDYLIRNSYKSRLVANSVSLFITIIIIIIYYLL
jgi:hypothetical protein